MSNFRLERFAAAAGLIFVVMGLAYIFLSPSMDPLLLLRLKLPEYIPKTAQAHCSGISLARLRFSSSFSSLGHYTMFYARRREEQAGCR